MNELHSHMKMVFVTSFPFLVMNFMKSDGLKFVWIPLIFYFFHGIWQIFSSLPNVFIRITSTPTNEVLELLLIWYPWIELRIFAKLSLFIRVLINAKGFARFFTLIKWFMIFNFFIISYITFVWATPQIRWLFPTFPQKMN